MSSAFVYAHEIDFAFVACLTLTIVPLTAPVIPAATPAADGATNKVEIRRELNSCQPSVRGLFALQEFTVRVLEFFHMR